MPSALIRPTALRVPNAVKEFRHSDDAPQGKLLKSSRRRRPAHVLSEQLARLAFVVACSMNEKRAPVMRPPHTILHILSQAQDRKCPGLSYGECLHLLAAFDQKLHFR